MSAGENNSGGGDGQNAAQPTVNNGTVLERYCENTSCPVINLMSGVPKKNSTQFITEPTIKDKPILINGFTTIFQVEGNSAKLMDVKNPKNPAVPPKPLYRVVPNTHAHIVNYVVIDADGESLRKINENDSATMRKLLESQKVSADQMLKKLMINNNSNPSAAADNTEQTHQMPPAAQTSAVPSQAALNPKPNSICVAPGQKAASGTPPPVSVSNLPPLAPITVPSTVKCAVTTSTPAIQLPMRMHPNLKITAVASAETIGLSVSQSSTKAPISSAAPAVPSQRPLIAPVPLSTLLNAPPAPSAQPALPPSSAPQAAPAPSQPNETNIGNILSELSSLRQTVALLLAAQAQNNKK